MISKKLFPIIIFIYFFQYVSERNLNYFNFQKVSKKKVPMHHPSIKKSLDRGCGSTLYFSTLTSDKNFYAINKLCFQPSSVRILVILSFNQFVFMVSFRTYNKSIFAIRKLALNFVGQRPWQARINKIYSLTFKVNSKPQNVCFCSGSSCFSPFSEFIVDGS